MKYLKNYLLLILTVAVAAEIDPNFYIFLAFGDSNMVGKGKIGKEDKDSLTDRFQMMPAIDMPLQNRKAYNWYKAVPPLCRQWSELSPLDNFGRTLVKNLPKEVTIGVINVAVEYASIDIFNEDKCEDYVKTANHMTQQTAAEYGNHPFRVLIEAAKMAQKKGIIKGILLHQGEANNGDQNWPENVRLIYKRILKELDLKSKDVPLLVGELLSKEQGGEYYGHNEIIKKIPELIPYSYVITSRSCESNGEGDRNHLNPAGNKLIGQRYAEKWLEINGYEIKIDFDPNFYIFLAFGQSNMEGQGDIEDQDREGIPDRFKVMAAINFTTLDRVAGEWYKAEPPLCRDWAGISPLDYFGRTLVEKLPTNISVGVINVAVGGCSIMLFDEERAEKYLETTEDWLKKIASLYNNNPFRVLVDTAKKAEKYGVIKGILLHQGESDTGDENWPHNVRLVYNRLLEELNLKAENVPLLVGELVSNEEGGLCYSHNAIIRNITNEINNSYVISSEGCESKYDGYHFNTEGYRLLGKRYAETMYEYLMNHK